MNFYLIVTCFLDTLNRIFYNSYVNIRREFILWMISLTLKMQEQV